MELKKTTWTRREVMELLNMPGWKVQFYSEQRNLLPGFQQNVGRGKVRKYNKYQLIGLMVINKLADMGVNISVISDIMFQFYAERGQWWNEKENAFRFEHYYIIFKSKHMGISMSFEGSERPLVTLMMERHPSAIVINVGLLVREANL